MCSRDRPRRDRDRNKTEAAPTTTTATTTTTTVGTATPAMTLSATAEPDDRLVPQRISSDGAARNAKLVALASRCRACIHRNLLDVCAAPPKLWYGWSDLVTSVIRGCQAISWEYVDYTNITKKKIFWKMKGNLFKIILIYQKFNCFIYWVRKKQGSIWKLY